MEKKIAYIGTLILFIATFGAFFHLNEISKENEILGEVSVAKEKTETPAVLKDSNSFTKEPVVAENFVAEVSGATAVVPEEVSQIEYKAKVLVDANSYDALSGISIYEAMLDLKKRGEIEMEARPFSGLGYRVDSINGKGPKGGYYWTLYVNDEYSKVGASSYVLKEGDVIEWKYEKN